MAATTVIRTFSWRTGRHALLGTAYSTLYGKKISSGSAGGNRPQPMGLYNPRCGALAPGAV